MAKTTGITETCRGFAANACTAFQLSQQAGELPTVTIMPAGTVASGEENEVVDLVSYQLSFTKPAKLLSYTVRPNRRAEYA